MKHYELNYFIDMPLNQAHLYERKAVGFLEDFKWQDAKEYYIKAADSVLQAMEKTTSRIIRQSLQLQYDSFKNQVRIVEIKKQEHELESKSIKIKKIPNLTIEKPKKQVGTLHRTDNPHLIMHEREPDSLLQFLSTGDNRVLEHDHSISHRRKIPKLSREIIEELETKNQTLRKWVNILLEEKETMAAEYRKLKDENVALQKELNSFYTNPTEVENPTNKSPECPTDTEPQSYFYFENNSAISPQEFQDFQSKT